MLASKLIQYWVRTSRAIDLTAVLVASFPQIENQSSIELGWKNADHKARAFTAAELKRDPEGIWDALKEGLANVRGCKLAPLAYAVRTLLLPKASAADLAADYASLDDELISRMPIILSSVTGDPDDLEVSPMRNFEPHFKQDNMLVFEYLKASFGGSTWWIHAKTFQKAKNGRQAFRSIHKHVFGQAAMNARHTTNRSDVEALHYQGEKARQTFSTYVGRHKECHVIQSSLAEGGMFNDFTASEKVNFLLQGIKVSDLDAAVANIQSSPALMSDFDQCCTNIADFIRLKQARTPGRARNVAAVDTHRGGGAGRGKRGGDRGHYGPSGGGGTRDRRAPRDKALDEEATFKADHITECWYPKDKFDNLTKLELHKLRMNQDEQRA